MNTQAGEDKRGGDGDAEGQLGSPRMTTQDAETGTYIGETGNEIEPEDEWNIVTRRAAGRFVSEQYMTAGYDREETEAQCEKGQDKLPDAMAAHGFSLRCPR